MSLSLDRTGGPVQLTHQCIDIPTAVEQLTGGSSGEATAALSHRRKALSLPTSSML